MMYYVLGSVRWVVVVMMRFMNYGWFVCMFFYMLCSSIRNMVVNVMLKLYCLMLLIVGLIVVLSVVIEIYVR